MKKLYFGDEVKVNTKDPYFIFPDFFPKGTRFYVSGLDIPSNENLAITASRAICPN